MSDFSEFCAGYQDRRYQHQVPSQDFLEGGGRQDNWDIVGAHVRRVLLCLTIIAMTLLFTGIIIDALAPFFKDCDEATRNSIANLFLYLPLFVITIAGSSGMLSYFGWIYRARFNPQYDRISINNNPDEEGLRRGVILIHNSTLRIYGSILLFLASTGAISFMICMAKISAIQQLFKNCVGSIFCLFLVLLVLIGFAVMSFLASLLEWVNLSQRLPGETYYRQLKEDGQLEKDIKEEIVGCLIDSYITRFLSSLLKFEKIPKIVTSVIKLFGLFMQFFSVTLMMHKGFNCIKGKNFDE